MGLSIIGGGAWGTALAIVASRNDPMRTVYLCARDLELVNAINNTHTNQKYLPGISIPKNVIASQECISHASNIIVLAVPAQYTKSVCQNIVGTIDDGTIVVVTAKGIDIESEMFISQVVSSVLPNNRICALSGPGLAKEVASGCKTLVTLGGCAHELSGIMSDDSFSTEITDDLIGVQVCGALKNVLGIALGFAVGHGCGDNAKARLFTRALYEMSTLCTAMGGVNSTVMMACGVGDLFLSCASLSSRNTALGYSIARGTFDSSGKLPEGYHTSGVLCKLITRLGLDMPLCLGVRSLLQGDIHNAMQYII